MDLRDCRPNVDALNGRGVGTMALGDEVLCRTDSGDGLRAPADMDAGVCIGRFGEDPGNPGGRGGRMGTTPGVPRVDLGFKPDMPGLVRPAGDGAGSRGVLAVADVPVITDFGGMTTCLGGMLEYKGNARSVVEGRHDVVPRR